MTVGSCVLVVRVTFVGCVATVVGILIAVGIDIGVSVVLSYYTLSNWVIPGA